MTHIHMYKRPSQYIHYEYHHVNNITSCPLHTTPTLTHAQLPTKINPHFIHTHIDSLPLPVTIPSVTKTSHTFRGHASVHGMWDRRPDLKNVPRLPDASSK